ncbi:hypothetical protein ACP275_08G157300 [Erythranthe tilingii]
MQKSRQEMAIKKQRKLQISTRNRGCKALCCGCRLSVSSSSEEPESSTNSSDRFCNNISSIAHAMVQERLDQMIRERREARVQDMIRRSRSKREGGTRFVVMVAMEKSSYDPREDFRESMEQMICGNSMIREAKDLRRLLNCYLKMNSEEFRGVILEVFYDVCNDLFPYCE